MASRCISKLARSQPPSVSPNSHDYGVQVCTVTASKCISKLAQSRPPSVSPNSLAHGLRVHLQTRSITACKCTCNTSKKYFRLGGISPLEWMGSVRAIRDTPVADYSMPGVNSTRRVPYRPLISVSPFLLVLWVSYIKQSLWRCGQL